MRFDKQWAAALVVVILYAGSSAQSSDKPILVYKEKYVMGTVFEIAAYAESSEQGSAAIDKALQEIVRMDDLMSNYKPESALSRLNRSAHFHAQKVPPDLYRVIEQARAVFQTLGREVRHYRRAARKPVESRSVGRLAAFTFTATTSRRVCWIRENRTNSAGPNYISIFLYAVRLGRGRQRVCR